MTNPKLATENLVLIDIGGKLETPNDNFDKPAIRTETPDGKPILVAGRDHVVVGIPESRQLKLQALTEIKLK